MLRGGIFLLFLDCCIFLHCCNALRVTILPDRWISEPSWVATTKQALDERLNTPVEVITMPDPYCFNNKRYESFWLSFLRDTLDADTLVVAHGTSADACLRYLEMHCLAGIVLIAPGELYHAGERHGRPLVWSKIVTNCRRGAGLIFGSQDPFVGIAEGRRIKGHLEIPDDLCREVEGGTCHFRNVVALPEVQDLTMQLSINGQRVRDP